MIKILKEVNFQMSIKNTVKSFVSVLLALTLAFLFTGCKENKKVNNRYRTVNASVFDSQEIASNESFILSWDNNASAILLTSVKTGEIWSNILYDSYKNGDTSVAANSSIDITVSNTKTLKWATVKSRIEIPAKGKILCKKIENGIRVTYFFDTYKIAVPIEYVLRGDSVLASVNTSQILEDGDDYKLVSVSVAPFFCSVKNNTKNGYLVVPVGCGALMDSYVTTDGSRNFTGEVYGKDATRQVPKNFTDDEEIRMPIFGSTNGKTLIMGIIEEGAGSAEISAQSGNERIGYANIGVSFYVRGYDEFEYSSHGTGNGIAVRISEKMMGNRCSVGFYPLIDEDADYTSMASRYRKYLTDNKMLLGSKSDSSLYSVTLLGGTRITKSFFGIPYKKTKALTTFSDALKIAKELTESIGVPPTIRMFGYGTEGIFPGEIDAGKNIPSIYGKLSELKSFSDYCKNNNIDLFFDHEIVNFSKSGNGFGIHSDVSQTAINKKIVKYPLDSLRMDIETSPYSVISRDGLISASQKAEKKAEKIGINGISYSSLGGTAFSDFSSLEYQNKAQIENDVAKIISGAKNKGYLVACTSANSYAAGLSDALFDVPFVNGDYNAFDACIPLYQMVFSNNKSLFSNAINLAGNKKKAFAKAVSFGMGLSFSVSEKFVSDSDDLDIFPLYGTVFKDNINFIKECVKASDYEALFEKIKNDYIVDYSISDNGISCTEYSSGTTVYVNNSDKTLNSIAGNIAPYSFKAIYKGGK